MLIVSVSIAVQSGPLSVGPSACAVLPLQPADAPDDRLLLCAGIPQAAHMRFSGLSSSRPLLAGRRTRRKGSRGFVAARLQQTSLCQAILLCRLHPRGRRDTVATSPAVSQRHPTAAAGAAFGGSRHRSGGRRLPCGSRALPLPRSCRRVCSPFCDCARRSLSRRSLLWHPPLRRGPPAHAAS